MPSRWQQHWQRWQSCRPHLHRDGLSLPAPWLERRLQAALADSPLHDVSLQLTDNGGILEAGLQRPLSARLALHFSFGDVNWPARTLHIDYRLQGRQHDNALVKRVLAGLLLTTLDSGTGSALLRKLAADCDFLDIHPHHIIVHLERLPHAGSWLGRDILGQPLAARLAITRLSCHAGYLRLHLGRPPQG